MVFTCRMVSLYFSSTCEVTPTSRMTGAKRPDGELAMNEYVMKIEMYDVTARRVFTLGIYILAQLSDYCSR